MNYRTCLILLLICWISSSVSAQQIIEMPEAGSGVVYFRIKIGAGSAADPVGKEGLAHITAMLLSRGAGSWSRQAFEQRLDELAADIEVHVEKEYTMVVARCVRPRLTEFYPLLLAMIKTPSFTSTQFKASVADAQEALLQLQNSNEDLGLTAFDYMLYRSSRWQHPALGWRRSLASIKRQDVIEFHKAHYQKQNIWWGIAGDYLGDLWPDKSTLVQQLQKDLASLNASSATEMKNAMVPPPAPPPAKMQPGRRVLLVEKPGLDQGQINIGFNLAINRAAPEFAPLYIANEHLGSHRNFTGVLMNSVRAERGLTYGAYSYLEYFPYPYRSGASTLPMPNIARSLQAFRLWTFTLNENLNFTTRLLLYKMQEWLTRGLTPKRFAAVKQFAINKFVFQTESLDRRLAMRLDDLTYGTKNFAAEFPQALQRATLKQLQTAMQQQLQMQDLVIVITTKDVASLRQALLAEAAVVHYQSGISATTLQAEDTVVKSFALGLSDAAIETIHVDALFAGP